MPRNRRYILCILIGTKDSLYVGEGTYECYQFANGSGWYRQVKIAFTVKDKGIETTASVN